jgi:hypothetical protein
LGDAAVVVDQAATRGLKACCEQSRKLVGLDDEATTNIRIYGTPSKAILEVLRQSAGSGIPTTVLPEHLGGFTR